MDLFNLLIIDALHTHIYTKGMRRLSVFFFKRGIIITCCTAVAAAAAVWRRREQMNDRVDGVKINAGKKLDKLLRVKRSVSSEVSASRISLNLTEKNEGLKRENTQYAKQ